MASFVLNSKLTIGKISWSGVHEVETKRSLHSYEDTAKITIPSIGLVKYKNQDDPVREVMGKLFNDGDKVTIQLGYNGELQEEFRGFVKRRSLEMPLIIECEGYSWQMRRNKISGTWKSISVSDLLKKAIAGTDIKQVICTHDTELGNVGLKDVSGVEILDFIKKETDGCLTIFFIQPDVLWCGLTYTPYSDGSDAFNQGIVSYRLGFNVVKDNGLKERVIEDNPAIVHYNKTLAKGQRISGTSADPLLPQFRKHRKTLNRIIASTELKALAQEKQFALNYTGYEGKITAFLVPYCLPGYKANVYDSRYPERDGTYIVDSVEVKFGVNGARRIVEIGPKVGFGKV